MLDPSHHLGGETQEWKKGVVTLKRITLKTGAGLLDVTFSEMHIVH